MSNRREFLLLADTFKADKHDPVGMLMSEKLDGNRCWWDGGVSRGRPTIDVPWASIHHPKTGELKDKIKPVASGLWSRYGNPVQAPEWFLDALPKNFCLDGELFAGVGNFQHVQKAVRRDEPIDEQWLPCEKAPDGIFFAAFGAPTYRQVLQDGLIKNANFWRQIDARHCLAYVAEYSNGNVTTVRMQEDRIFTDAIDAIDEICRHCNTPLLRPVNQTVCEGFDHLQASLAAVTEAGGEGVMLRDPNSVWFPKRRPFILKVKPRFDSEATIVGFVAGRKGKTGQFLGKLGTLVVETVGDKALGLEKGVIFELGTGLTHADRELHNVDVPNAKANPGKPLTGLVSCTPTFTIGDRVTFSYRELSDEGTPKEGAYLRLRNEQ